ncbi:MAG: asparagine synthase C-terminal domain-containing protein [Flavobacterium sp.]|uniref:asparagine synthase C-terminal domain-containing protein n=1 Tax=Flavobacterium sp. TaxID=239 RepID=UPI0032646CBD
MFRNYNYLGYNNPYYFTKEGKFEIHQNFPKAIAQFPGEKVVDPAAAIEMLNKEFFLGDRTVIENLNKTPWLAKPNTDFNHWEYDEAPKHGSLNIEEKEIAKILFQKICDEIALYVGDKKSIGILLSGGMDSRMVAGALDFLMKNNKVSNLKVTAVTWGNSNTRDVIYAKKISERLNWEWKHYPVTAEGLLQNIRETAIYGCEYSPMHLHAIPQIRDDNDFDVILAGSYGDSVGRAEFGGKNIRHVEPLLKNIHNVSSLFRDDVFEDSIKKIENDVTSYHKLFPRDEKYMQNELDYQLHYMRRMLNPCMDLFNEKMEFYQVFSHPDVYSFMWTIHPDKRNDDIYKHMLLEFVTPLDDIPWARTGLKYGEKTGIPDEYLKRHHTYVHILQKEILEDIKKMVLREEFKSLGIFKYKSIEILFKLIKYFPLNSLYYTEKVAWLASLAEMSRLYKVKGNPQLKKAEFNEYSIIYEYMKRYSRNKAGYFLRKLSLIK